MIPVDTLLTSNVLPFEEINRELPELLPPLY